MRLGIDFGTNRTVVAAADRGNYPLVSFETADGLSADWYPSLVALRGSQRRYGWDAWELQADPSWTVVRSLKRLLEDAGPDTLLELDDQQTRISDLLRGFTGALRTALVERSNLRLKPGEPMEIILGVPANANSNQRFLTVESFRATGFHTLGVLNEPSAASIEFGHRQSQGKSPQQTILVYDLGGGTIDASLVTLDEHVHHVIASEGIPTIGGDDFDQVLAEMALEAAGVSLSERDQFPAAIWFRLLEECRAKKESLNPNSRRIAIDLEQVDPAWGTVQIAVTEFYEAVRPLVEETIAAAEELLGSDNQEFEALYITGGGSELPLVARALRERFGRRVRRSAYTRSATAIGLAIQADQPERYRLSDRLSRYFGVWREADAGCRIVFDPLFEKGAPLPPVGEPALSITRSYSPVHNVGHFRFLECSHRMGDGAPSGEVTVWDEIRFPFEPELQECTDLVTCPVAHSDGASAQRIQEHYECDAGGAITVRIMNESSGHERTYRLGHWSKAGATAKPTKASSRKKNAATARGAAL
jgi:molecular chaperone DnaK